MNFPNLNNKYFTTAKNSSDGEVDENTSFHYHQQDRLIWAEYSGGEIVKGHLIGIINDNCQLEMRYHHINKSGELMTGKCTSTPKILADGRIKLKENWQWTCGNFNSGQSEIVEVLR